MSPFINFKLSVFFTLFITNINGQVAITYMYGQTNGLTGRGYGTMEGAPRNISTAPALLDVSIFDESQAANASPCGRTIITGKLDMKKSLDRAEDGGLPDVGQNGKVKLIAHVANARGSGPYTCAVDTNADGANFVNVPVTVNVPSNFTGKPTDFSLEAQLPNSLKCAGGADGQSCIIKCINSAPKGPFGGCMAFTQMQGLYNDPSPAGSGPTAGFHLDRITENPITRDQDLFHDAKAKLTPKDLQAAQALVTPATAPAAPAAKGKRRSLSRFSR